jgi:hypothetical protein
LAANLRPSFAAARSEVKIFIQFSACLRFAFTSTEIRVPQLILIAFLRPWNADAGTRIRVPYEAFVETFAVLVTQALTRQVVEVVIRHAECFFALTVVVNGIPQFFFFAGLRQLFACAVSLVEVFSVNALGFVVASP